MHHSPQTFTDQERQRRLASFDGLVRSEGKDRESLLYHNEQRDRALLEEGIIEAGFMCSFIPTGTAYAAHGINTIPFLPVLLDFRRPPPWTVGSSVSSRTSAKQMQSLPRVPPRRKERT